MGSSPKSSMAFYSIYEGIEHTICNQTSYLAVHRCKKKIQFLSFSLPSLMLDRTTCPEQRTRSHISTSARLWNRPFEFVEDEL